MNEWGPAQDEHRAEFISMIRSNDSLRQAAASSQVCISSTHIPPGLGDPELNDAGDSGCRRKRTFVGSSSVALDSEGGFFQSKLSIAEKLTMAHNRELAKRSGVDLSHLDTEALTASQIVSSSPYFVLELLRIDKLLMIASKSTSKVESDRATLWSICFINPK